MVMGCYYLTDIEPKANGTGKKFANPQEAKLTYDLGGIDMRAEIEVRNIRGEEGYGPTTVGRIIFNEVVPESAEVAYLNIMMDKRQLKDLVGEIHKKIGNDDTAKFLDGIKDLGFKYATKSGATIAITDIEVPKVKVEILAHADDQIHALEKQYQRGLITRDERYRRTVDIWTKTGETMEEVIKKELPNYGSIFLMATSGAKGNIAQIKQMAGMRGLMTDTRGRIIELPIRASSREGLSVLEYFISTHGARKGLADTALRTADSGYLTRRLIDVSQDVIVGDGEHVAIHPRDVGQLAHRQRTLDVFLAAGVGAQDGVSVQRLGHGDRLAGADGAAGVGLARHHGPQGAARVGAAHRRVGMARRRHPGVDQGAVGPHGLHGRFAAVVDIGVSEVVHEAGGR